MKHVPSVGKRDFIQHTSQYLKQAELEGGLIITHQNKPALKLVPVKTKSIYDLKGIINKIKVKGDINEPVLPGYDQW